MTTNRNATSPPGRRARPPRSRLLRLWAIAATAYILVAAAISAGPLKTAIEHAQSAQAQTAAQLRPATAPKGPLPDAPATPAQRIAKAVGLEVLLLLAPPLLLLWFGWDVWFALAGFFPALSGAGPQATETPEDSREPDGAR